MGRSKQGFRQIDAIDDSAHEDSADGDILVFDSTAEVYKPQQPSVSAFDVDSIIASSELCEVIINNACNVITTC